MTDSNLHQRAQLAKLPAPIGDVRGAGSIPPTPSPCCTPALVALLLKSFCKREERCREKVERKGAEERCCVGVQGEPLPWNSSQAARAPLPDTAWG